MTAPAEYVRTPAGTAFACDDCGAMTACWRMADDDAIVCARCAADRIPPGEMDP